MFSRYYFAPRITRAASTATSTTYYDTVNDDADLVAYWRLGDTGGTATDETGNYDAAFATASFTTGVTGLIGDGNDAMSGTAGATIAVSTLNPWSSAFTVEAWAVESNGTAGYAGILSAGTYTVDGFRFGRTGSSWAVWTDESGGDVLLSGGAVSVGGTAHVAATQSGGTFTLYVNGDPVGTASGTYNTPGAGCSLFGHGGGEWYGTLDEIAVYSAAKDASWVSDHYDLGVAATPAPTATYAVDTLSNGDLEAYWRLGDSGATVTDTGPNNYDMNKGSGWTTGSTGLIDDTDTAMTGDGTTNIGAASTSLNPWSSAFTVEAWVSEGVGTTAYRGVAGAGTYLTNGFRLGRREQRWAFWTDENGGDVIVRSADAAVTVGTTTHLVATRSGTTYKLYVNGVDVTTASGDSTGTSYVAPTSGGMTVGGYGGGNWQGVVDEVAVYSSAKSSAWAAARYALGAP